MEVPWQPTDPVYFYKEQILRQLSFHSSPLLFLEHFTNIKSLKYRMQCECQAANKVKICGCRYNLKRRIYAAQWNSKLIRLKFINFKFVLLEIILAYQQNTNLQAVSERVNFLFPHGGKISINHNKTKFLCYTITTWTILLQIAPRQVRCDFQVDAFIYFIIFLHQNNSFWI